MAHTSEPWSVNQDGKPEMRNVTNIIYGRQGELVSYGHLSEDDAKRIILCVNACESITNTDLQAYLLGFTVRDALFTISRLSKQREELLAALERILENDGAEGSKCFDALNLYDARVDARAAIASMKGGA